MCLGLVIIIIFKIFFLYVLDLGLQQHRLEGDEYISVIDEFMEAVFTRWPHVIVQVRFQRLLRLLFRDNG